jgi:predicted lipoprotein with Yx(FWY)xxD motif
VSSIGTGAAVQGGQVGRFERTDGTVQVTYFEHPLYLYTGDAEPGQRTGHDLQDEFGHWSLVGPDGKPLSTR